jgi:hypothetical protein
MKVNLPIRQRKSKRRPYNTSGVRDYTEMPDISGTIMNHGAGDENKCPIWKPSPPVKDRPDGRAPTMSGKPDEFYL